MRAIIVPIDKLVVIDGVARGSLNYTVDAAVHAVQWYDTYGEVEYVTTANGKPANQKITSLDAFQSAIDAWNAAAPSTPNNNPIVAP